MHGLLNSSRSARCRLAVLSLGSLALAGTVQGQVLNCVVTLDGDQEVPPVATAASGTGTVTLDLATNELTWNISFANLSSPQTAAHFHGNAPQCESAGVVLPLPVGSPIVGSATITPTEASDLMAGLWYVNIHTQNHPPGEIRGQVMPEALEDPIVETIPAGAVHVRLEPVAGTVTAPNWGTSAPGHPSRLVVTDQPGTIWTIDLETGDRTMFLDVSPLLVELGALGPMSFDERGLLGVAFHPGYETNGLLYTYTSEPVFKPADFSTMPPGVLPNHRTVIREWRVPDPTDPASVVDPTTARTLLRIDQPQFNHNAGALVFGVDDMLYISLGDGGGGDDKDGQISLGAPMVGHGCVGNGQNAEGQNILGSLVRIDPLGSNSANGQYGIPQDNPFVAPGDPRVDEIFAYGFRNPFRFSIDAVTGDIHVADVGQRDIEEIDLVISGGNYGWNQKEGSFFFVANGNAGGYVTDVPLAVGSNLIDPIAEYDHDEGISIIGGFVYRGAKLPALEGRYVFGDFSTSFLGNNGRLFYLDENNDVREFPLVGQAALDLSLLGFGQDADGEIYVLGNTTGIPFGDTGVVLRITNGLGDANADGVVDVLDLLDVLSGFGPYAPCPPHVPADFNNDCVVDVLDLLEVLTNWT